MRHAATAMESEENRRRPPGGSRVRRGSKRNARDEFEYNKDNVKLCQELMSFLPLNNFFSLSDTFKQTDLSRSEGKII